ncbi:unnamed protein product [Tilletia controversa]|uniref:Ubiquitin-like domain-containing protein n=1 Tax=Tilletia controversa TaxID=13291 RepID=A0A8X7MZF0_9BASI|nr:hypothetical protein CF328_g1495 [Tilletia controversa]KAE8253386.1 hypothetical protein A4X06_0g1487 [Tilletia controversa]CAD6905982.1 unnamed protein product [Tilletia controversa]CAD6961046.1 unnamed protein product [Tilletia controversa]
MEISHSVTTASGKTITFEVDSSGGVDKVTTKIQGKKGVSMYEQRLILNGDRLHTDSTLSNDKAQHQTPADRSLSSDEPRSSESDKIWVYFQNDEGDKFILDVDPSAPMGSVRWDVQQGLGVPVVDQMFRFCGKRLSDLDTFSGFNIGDDDVIDVVRRIPSAGSQIALTPLL